VTWNDTVIAHPHLSPTDKLIFHLLARAGSQAAAQRRQVAQLLRQTKRNIDKSLCRLATCGFDPTDPAENYSAQPRTTVPNEENYSSQTRTTVLKNTPSFNAPTRTLWSSSSEEDVQEKNQYPSSPRGTAEGEEEVPVEFLVAMRRVWKTIAPQEDEEPRDWFFTLYREFGPQIPLAVLRQFALGDRILSQLRHPSSYKSYFACCCRKAREESLALTGPFHTVEGLDQAAPPRSQAEFEQDWVALARAHNAAERRRFQLEMERSP